MTRRFWWGVVVGAGLAWWFSKPAGGKGGDGSGYGGPKRARGRMSWSGLGRFR